MRIIQWLLSTFVFLFLCALFFQFGNSILNVVLLTSLAAFFIKLLVEKYASNY